MPRQPPIALCTLPTQCDASLVGAKTATTLAEIDKYLVKWWKERKCAVIENEAIKDNQIHPVHIIFSDCNLIGAKAWGTRSMTYFQDAKFNIAVFSSKEKQCKNYNDLSCLIQDGINNDFKKKINVAVCCTHGTRFKNISKLITSYGKDPDKVKKYKFYLYFDEFDKWIGLLNKYVPKWKKNKYDNIEKMICISATIGKKAWKFLHRLGIYSPTLLGSIEDISRYHRIKDNRLMYYESGEDAPFNNFVKVVEKKKLLSMGNIIFAPGGLKRLSHKKILDYCIQHHAYCIVMNGDGPDYYNGKKFHRPGDVPIDIYKYAKQKWNLNSTDAYPELYHILTALYEQYCKPWCPPLVITGFHCVERGVTFCTNTFCFTHAIFSNYHVNYSIESFLQIVGRTTGGSKYITHPIEIIAPQKAAEKAIRYQENLIELCSSGTETICAADFNLDTDQNIPIKFIIEDTDLLQKMKKEWSKTLTQKRKVVYRDDLIANIANEKIKIFNKNRNFNLLNDLKNYKFATKRCLQKADAAYHNGNPIRSGTRFTDSYKHDSFIFETYRLSSFNESWEHSKVGGQKCKNQGTFEIDITFVDAYGLKAGTGFISYNLQDVDDIDIDSDK